MFNRKALCRGMVAALLISASTSLYAVSAPTTYNYTITGDVLSGDEFAPNIYNLTVGETITAYGTFTVASNYATSGGTVSFEAGSGNTMTINLNGTLLTASNDTDYPTGGLVGPTLTFTSGWTLNNFDYQKITSPSFNSLYLGFDDFASLYGEWRINATVTAVPEADTYAMMLAGLGLLGVMVVRRKSLEKAA